MGESCLPLVSVVIPVKNEGRVLRRCLESLSRQSYPRDRIEIIVADALSADDTAAVAKEFGARVVSNPAQIVSSGRNAGYALSRGRIVAFTDADCVAAPEWVSRAAAHFDDPQVGGVGGMSLLPPDATVFESAVNALFEASECVGRTCHRQHTRQSSRVRDIPGCNAFYLRSALDKVMPVDEGLLTAEDVWMNRMLAKEGYVLLHAPDVVLWHYRRSSPKKLLRQAYRFAVGRLQVGKRDVSLLSLMHVVAGWFLPAAASAVWLMSLSGWGMPALMAAAGCAAVCALLRLAPWRPLAVAATVPFVTLIFLSGWSWGFLREWFVPYRDVRGR
jgi:glycosyltransferase involved in cell wall biosynthesis